VVNCFGDKSIRIWNVEYGILILVGAWEHFTGHESLVLCVEVLSNGRTLRVDQMIKQIWNGDCLKTLEGHKDRVFSI